MSSTISFTESCNLDTFSAIAGSICNLSSIKAITSSRLLATQTSSSFLTKKELVPAPFTITSAKSSKLVGATVASPPLIKRVPKYKAPADLSASS
jgi:hypothetical protein